MRTVVHHHHIIDIHLHPMMQEFIRQKKRELEQWKSHPDIKEWDIYQFVQIIKKKDAELRTLRKTLKYYQP
jgi:hypothetical protein